MAENLENTEQIDVITEGDYQLLLPDHPWIYAYRRAIPGQRLTVICSFHDQIAEESALSSLCRGKLLRCNYSTPEAIQQLRPYEARVYLEADA